MYKLATKAGTTFKGYLLETLEVIDSIKDRFPKIKMSEKDIVAALEKIEGVVIEKKGGEKKAAPVKKTEKKED